MSVPLIILTLLGAVPIVHGLWVLAYAAGPRRTLETRLND